MLNALKRIFCFFIAGLFLNSKSERDLDEKIDYIIDKKKEDKIKGDNDLLKAIQYVIAYRKYKRNCGRYPTIENSTVLKCFLKSVII